MPSLVKSDGTVRKTASAAWVCGQLVLADDGRVGIVSNAAGVASGDVATLQMFGQVELPAAANLSAGDVAGIHIANQNAIASGGAGSTKGGIVLKTVTSGGTALVELNQWPQP